MSTPTPTHTTPTSAPGTAEVAKPSNFLRQIIENDLDNGTYAARRWAGSPGDAAHHAAGQPDPASRTRKRTRSASTLRISVMVKRETLSNK